MMTKRILLSICLLVANFGLPASANELIIIAKKQLNNTYNQLKNQPTPVHYLAYGITDVKKLTISSSKGKIDIIDSSKKRVLDIDLRVGTPKLDNTHIIRGEANFFFFGGTGRNALPIENDEKALRRALWMASDRAYKNAVETYDKILTNIKVKVAEEDSSDDFSYYPPQKYSEEAQEININVEKWSKILNRVSELFNRDPQIFFGKVYLAMEHLDKYFIASDGTELRHSSPYIRIYISASTKADDGMSLPLYKSYFAYEEKDLPSEETIMKDANELIELLGKLREAPLMTIYSGPAILSGEASGVFFHEIFGHRVEGARLKDPNDAQTFKNSVGEQVLSDIISVYCDPTVSEIQGEKVSGCYKYDDEGVKAEKVVIAESGKFRNFLMSRSPIHGFEKSNGHARREPGRRAVSRQSNLIVKSSKVIPLSELKQALIDEAKKQGKEYGLYFAQVQGGFTFTGRSIPNSFNVSPILVYKIYVDGRPDEIVRGVDLIGTPLTTFANIMAAGDDLGVFNGICGAESGGVPVSAVSPSLLVSKIEVQKQRKSQAKLPILEAPQATINK